jgi:Uma2 family endonuclease
LATVPDRRRGRRVYRHDSPLVAPADVLLAVEIESPSSLTADRITKPAQYAALGIAHYW